MLPLPCLFHHKKPLAATVRAAAILLSFGIFANAQVGPGGWSEYFPKKSIQKEAGEAYNFYTDSAGVETFSMIPNPGRLRQRCEARVYDDYTSGIRQFEGYAKVDSGSDGSCIHQVWLFLMVVAWSGQGGELRQHSNGFLGSSNIYGKWIRINTIHNADAGTAEVWINGQKRYSMQSANGPNYYNKYGLYNGSGSHPRVQWRNVRYFSASSTAILPISASSGGARLESLGGAFRLTLPDPGAILTLRAVSGRILLTRRYDASGEFLYEPPHLPAGKYLLRVDPRDGLGAAGMAWLNPQ